MGVQLSPSASTYMVSTQPRAAEEPGKRAPVIAQSALSDRSCVLVRLYSEATIVTAPLFVIFPACS